MNASIPDERISSFKVALNTLFGNAEPENISLLMGGAPSKTYKFYVNNRAYVLRVMSFEDGVENRSNQVQCLQIAGDMGIAPECYYANPDTGIIISEFIDAKKTQVTEKWLREVAVMLRKLHTSHIYPEPHQPLFAYLQGLINKIRAMPLAPELITYLQRFDEVLLTLSQHLIKVPCHNDLNCKNVLFNGKFFFIDYEAAGMEDPFFDLATLCNEFASTKIFEEYFCREYFGKTPTAEQKAKLLLMKQVSYGYLALHYFLHAVNGGLRLMGEDMVNATHGLELWTQKFKSAPYELLNPSDFLQYGLMLVNQSEREMMTEECSVAKMILSKRE